MPLVKDLFDQLLPENLASIKQESNYTLLSRFTARVQQILIWTKLPLTTPLETITKSDILVYKCVDIIVHFCNICILICTVISMNNFHRKV